MVIYAYFIAAIWRVLRTAIRDRRRDDGSQMALRNGVYVGAGKSLEAMLDVRQVEANSNRIPLAKTTLIGAAGTFEPVARLVEFASCLGHATNCTPPATDLNPAIRWQLEAYEEEMKSLTVVTEACRQRAKVPREKLEPQFQKTMANSKDFDTRGVAWKPNEIWYHLCCRMCVVEGAG